MVRKILSVLIGLISAVIVFIIAESLNSLIHKVPPNFDFSNQQISFWLVILAGWIIGSLICGALISLISKSDNKVLPIIAGFILTLSAVTNFVLLSHPTWFIVVGLLVFIPSALLGNTLINGENNE